MKSSPPKEESKKEEKEENIVTTNPSIEGDILAESYILPFKKELEHGSYGEVYLAYKKEEMNAQNPVAYVVKLYFNDKLGDFKSEVEKNKDVREVKSDYITKFIDWGEGNYVKKDKTEWKHYMVLEYMKNGDLFKYIYYSKSGESFTKGFDEEFAQYIFYQILLGVKDLHDKGIFHMDIKPSNILLDEKYRPKICDFGSSIKVDNKDIEMKKGKPGTMSFQPPEMFKRPLSYKLESSETFSLGALLFYLVTGTYGFNAACKIIDEKYYKYLEKGDMDRYWEAIKVKTGRTDYSDDFKNLYLSMVNKDQALRPKLEKIIDTSPWLENPRNLFKKENSQAKSEFDIRYIKMFDERKIEAEKLIEEEREAFNKIVNWFPDGSGKNEA